MKSPAALSQAEREQRLEKWAHESGVELTQLDGMQRGVVLGALVFQRSRANRWDPLAPVTPECEPIPVPHAGGDDPHNKCADTFPPNRYPGMEVLLGGVRFDALQVGIRMLWEIKTNKFDTYPAFIQEREIEKEMVQIREERRAAAACGYGYMIGMSTQAHKDALLQRDDTLNIVVTGCKR